MSFSLKSERRGSLAPDRPVAHRVLIKLQLTGKSRLIFQLSPRIQQG